MNKYSHLGTSFDEILNHEIGHLLMNWHIGFKVQTIIINPKTRITRSIPSDKHKEATDAIMRSRYSRSVVQANLKHMKNYLLIFVAGDVMLDLVKYNYNSDGMKTRTVAFQESQEAYKYESLGVDVDAIVKKSASILTRKKWDYEFLKLWLSHNSVDEELDFSFANLQLLNKKLRYPFRHLQLLRTLVLRQVCVFH